MLTIKIKKPMRIIVPVLAVLLFCCTRISAMENPLIFPIPQQLQLTNESFVLDETIIIAIPKNATEKDVALAKLLVKELSNKYGIALKIESVHAIPKGKKVVMMGTLSNPLIKKYCADNRIALTKQSPGTEGYILNVSSGLIVIAGWDDHGAFFGFQSLRQLLQSGNGKIVQGVKVRDWPNLPFRA